MIHIDFIFEDRRLTATRGDVDWRLTIVDTFTCTQACLSMPDEDAAMLLNFMMLGDESLHNAAAHELLRKKYFAALPHNLWLIPFEKPMNTTTKLYKELLNLHHNRDIVISPEYLAEIALHFETIQNANFERLAKVERDVEFIYGILSFVEKFR